MPERTRLNDFLSLYLPSFFVMLGMSIVAPSLPLFAKSFGVSYTMVSLAISIYAVGRLIADIPMGLLVDRMGGRRMTILGTVVIAGAAFLNAMAPNFYWFLAFRFIQGVGSAMWQTARTTLLADMLKPEERGRVMGYFQSFMLIGGAAGPTIGGYVGEWWGVKAPFLAYGVVGLVSLVLSWLYVYDLPKTAHTSGDHGFTWAYVVKLLKIRAFAIACVATFGAFMLMTGIRQTMISLYANSVLGLDQAAIGSVLTYATVMNLLLTIPIAYGVDWLGRKPVTWICLILSAGACVLFPYTTDYVTISIAAALLGIGTTGAQQAPLAMVTDATEGEPRGISLGIYRFIGDIAFILGPVIMGVIADTAGLRLPFYVMTGILLVTAAITLIFGVETYSRRNEERKAETISRK